MASNGRQAGPLPSKRGEIGYTRTSDDESADSSVGHGYSMEDRRHPAERSLPNLHAPSVPPQAHLSVPRPSTSDSHPSSYTSFHASIPPSKYSLFMFLRSPQPNAKLGGLSIKTFARILFILASIACTGVGWMFAVNSLLSVVHHPQSPPHEESESPDIPTTTNSQATFIFVHIAFGTGILILLVLLERAVFQARAERFTFKHPDALPRIPRGAPSLSAPGYSSIAFAPWNRPSLPTYAAALGFRGTGDVEDGIIAGPPPPPYGNTRGSTLLLSGIPMLRTYSSESLAHSASRVPTVATTGGRIRSMRDSLRSMRSMLSSRGRLSRTEVREEQDGGGMVEDAERACYLEEALAKLEGNDQSQGPRRPALARLFDEKPSVHPPTPP